MILIATQTFIMTSWKYENNWGNDNSFRYYYYKL